MTPEEIFAAWAPAGAAWSLWARPVLFAQMPKAIDDNESEPWREIDVNAAPAAADCVLVLDLPGDESVWMALALAGRGFRPVPLFNGCTGPHEVISQAPIIAALQRGARHLRALSFDD